MEPLSIALALAKAAGADDWIKSKVGNLLGAKAANSIVDLALKVTETKSSAEALEMVQSDPHLSADLREALIANEHALLMAAYADRNQARATYKIHPEQADKLAERIMRWNLPYIAFLLIANCVALYFLKNHSELLLVIGNVLGMAIKSLFDERKEVTGFYFGGSMQSSPDNRDKD
jgi:hypothetical protein